MIIVLKEADFSANNIGKITMPISDFTLAAITASGNSGMTDAEKEALDSFFMAVGAIDNNGIWSKLDKVYLPFIGGDVTYGLVNYKDNNKDATLNSSYMRLVKGGVKTVKTDANTTSAEANNIVANYVWDWSSKSVFFLNTEQIPTESLDGIMNVCAYNTTWKNVWISSSGAYIATSATLSNNAIFEAHSAPYSSNVGSSLGISVNTSAAKIIGIDGVIRNALNYTAPTVDTTPNTLFPFSPAPAGTTTPRLIGTGALILGDYLDDTECTTLKTALDTLYAVFKDEERW